MSAPTKTKRQMTLQVLISAESKVGKYLLSEQEDSLLMRTTASIDGAFKISHPVSSTLLDCLPNLYTGLSVSFRGSC